ncbi:MAG: O-antigen ligase family protein [bacterium]|nr:O-antigen ligase family protein [bacterium]
MKKEYIILLFLLLGPLLDVASFLGLPFSILFRGFYLAGIILYLIVKKQELKFLIPLLIFGIILFLYQFLYLKFSFMSIASAVLKFLYLPISILYFKHYVFPIRKEKVFTTIFLTYISIFLLSYLFNIGADAYLESDGKSGFKGLFSSINEFSAILVCLLPIITFYWKQKKKWFLSIFLIVLSLGCSLLIGTKILMGGIVFTIAYLLWQEREYLFFKRTKKQKLIIVLTIGFIMVIGSFLFTKTRTYQNMKIQQDFFQVENVLSLEFMNRVVYNDRLTFLHNNLDYFKNQIGIKIILGIGLEDYDIKMVEIDIFDIAFRYGILGIIIFLSSITLSIDWQKIKKEEKVSIILLIIISLTSGHVLIYPASCIYFAVILSPERVVMKEKTRKIKNNNIIENI